MARLLLLLLLLTAPLQAATPAIRIKLPVERVILAAPGSMRLAIFLEPNPANRWVCLYVRQIQNGTNEHTSCWEVNADKEARTTWRDVKDLDAGQWDVVAAVLRNDDTSTLSNRYTVHVTGFGYSLPE